jgi:hypothetical protein
MTVNIARLTRMQRNAIQRDKIAALWAHNVKTGHEYRGQVTQRINSIKDERKRDDILKRFERFMNI